MIGRFKGKKFYEFWILFLIYLPMSSASKPFFGKVSYPSEGDAREAYSRSHLKDDLDFYDTRSSYSVVGNPAYIGN